MATSIEVMEASSAQEALLLLKEQHGSLDLIITNFEMPTMTGLELVEELLQTETPVNRIIVLSSIAKNEFFMKHLTDKHPHISFLNKRTTAKHIIFEIFRLTNRSKNQATGPRQ